MRYVLLFLLFCALGVVVTSVPKGGWALLWRAYRGYLPTVLISLVAVLATVLIAYFGGHIRVL